jgi:very-short-patch-repair endonuclease
MAAVLRYRPNAVLSHQSAGVLYGITKDRGHPIHISLTSPGPRTKERGIAVHRRRVLKPTDTTWWKGIPVTTVVLTLCDLATTLDDMALERAVNKADALDLIDPERLREAIDGLDRPGAARLRRLLDRDTFVVTESELEQLFLPLVRRAGLPLPESQRHFPPHRVDFYWPSPDLVVECDGLRYHRTAAQQAEDLRRNHAHAKARRLWLRFSHYQVAKEPGYVVETLRAVRPRRAGARRTPPPRRRP